MSSETPIVFSCRGENTIGILHSADEQATIGVVVVVGGPQYRVGSHRQFVIFARDIAKAGFPVFRFDFRGMGDAGGAFRDFESIDDDIRAAIDCLLNEKQTLTHIVLLGLCDAASANIMYAHRDKRVHGLIMLNPWARTDSGEARAFLRHYYFSRFLQKSFWRKVFSGQFEIRRSIKDLADNVISAGDSDHTSTAAGGESFLHRMELGASKFDGPILLIISGRDLTAAEFLDETDNSKTWRQRLDQESVARKTFPDADHTMSTRRYLDDASTAIVQWLDSLQ